MFWSFVLLALLLLAQQRLKDAFLLLKNKRICLTVLLCSALLGFNWLLFIVAINNSMIVQVSLAYFMVPILNMLTGILLFKEKLIKAQWLALALVVCGVSVQVVFFGEVPWLALGLSLSWAAYGGAHKAVRYPAIPGFFLETAVIVPALIGAWLWIYHENGYNSFTGFTDLPQILLLLGSGIATVLPQIWFVYGAQRLRQTILGLCQFLAPTLFLLVGVVIYGETVSLVQKLSFGFIWVAMLLYCIASLRRSQQAAI